MQQLLANYLINAAWQVPVVALCAWLVSRFGGLGPAARNRVWRLFLGIAAILPAVSLGTLLPHVGPTIARVPTEATAMAAFEAATPTTASLAPAVHPAMALTAWAAPAMSVLCAAIVLVLIARLTLAGLAARRLVRQSQPFALPAAVAEDLERLAHSHHRKAAPVRRSRGVSGPAVVGVVSPVILLPEGPALGEDDLRAALLHEMAHVIRHDYAMNLACEVLTLPVCWHPALLGLKAGVARSRELACDAMAATALGSSKTYARRLVSLAQTLGAPAPAGAASLPSNTALAVGLFGRSDLEDRLMHLMKPKDTEPMALRAARLCGLAAVGAGLLGSAALLHVTPVFAQDIAPVAATPLAAASPGADTAVSQAQADAAPAGHGGSTTITRHRVVMNMGRGGHRHSFVGADGREFDVDTDSAADLTPEQKRHFEDVAAKADAKAAEIEKKVNSPEFKARIAAAEKAGRDAEAMVNSPEFKARIAAAEKAGRDAEAMVNSPAFKAKIAAAEKAGRDAEARANSPEFKARIAAAEKAGRDAEAMVNSPEFKAKIAAAQARAADVEKMVNSPEFKAKIQKAAEAGAWANSPEFRARMDKLTAEMAAMGERMSHQFDDAAPTTPTP